MGPECLIIRFLEKREGTQVSEGFLPKRKRGGPIQGTHDQSGREFNERFVCKLENRKRRLGFFWQGTTRKSKRGS